ncbi:MAG: hypothetical protein VX893_02785 [Candidatus Latescibacterota bacterium]|nr:hypothetical protein [Candidatus Latescibacterota bacterium]
MKCKISLLCSLLLFSGCSHRYYAEDLKPVSEAEQGQNKTVADDGTVAYKQARLEISLRPMTDEELNRQFSAYSSEGADSRNPYTFGNSTYFRTGETPQRFTVFRAFVSNYEYPKVYLDPTQVYITTSNGRKYYALTREQISIYYRRYVQGGTGGNAPGVSGNAHSVWKERDGIMRRSMYVNEQVFSAQESEGFLVFEPLAPDVDELTVHIPDVIVRYDYKGDPLERVDVEMSFERKIGRVYPDGSKVATGN